jgi:hypothetical protein
MKALLLDGAPAPHGDLDRVRDLVVDSVSAAGFEVDAWNLRECDIEACCGCFGCWVRTPGVCVVKDDGRELARRAVRCDLLLLLTPVIFGGYSTMLKRAVERLVGTITPFFITVKGEVHHRPRYARYPCLVGIGVLPRRDTESAQLFESLVARNALNLHSPASAAGVVVPREGMDAVRHEVLRLLTLVGVPSAAVEVQP